MFVEIIHIHVNWTIQTCKSGNFSLIGTFKLPVTNLPFSFESSILQATYLKFIFVT